MDSNTVSRGNKSQRLNVRVTQRQELLIRRAAEATDRTVTDFMLESASIEAERILADRHRFVATDADWAEFDRLLDSPLPSTAKLSRLMQRDSPFSD